MSTLTERLYNSLAERLAEVIAHEIVTYLAPVPVIDLTEQRDLELVTS